jgi:hypothetical protein
MAELERSLAGKKKELQEQADSVKQKEATTQRLSKARAEADDRAQQLAKKLQDLEAALRVSCFLPVNITFWRLLLCLDCVCLL